jgi:flagellar hook-associated protein 2
MGTTGTGTLYFTGLSTYSNDFQSVIGRAVSIAKIPLANLQNQQTDNINKKAALVALEPMVASLASAVTALGTVAATQGVTASSSDSSTVSVVSTGASSAATYTISNIQSLATLASETSLAGYADPANTRVSISGHVNLVVGSNTYNLDVTGNNSLIGLASAINNSGAPVSATVITAAGQSYLSVSASNTGATTLQLNDVPGSLISSNGQGAETSLNTYADTTTAPVSKDGHVDLVVGSNTYHLDLTGHNNLSGLQNAINASGSGVTASITGSGPYGLSLSYGGPVSMQLNDIPNNPDLITNTNQGTNADFMLNGTIHVVRSTNVVNDIIPGVSFTLLQTNPGSVTLSLASDSSQLSDALQTFVGAYNSLVDQVDQQIGPAAGPLGGNGLIQNITSDMQQLATYWNTGPTSSIHSLSDVGVTFDTTGHLSFDPNVFSGLSSSQVSDAFKFFGSSSTGFAALANNFTGLTDPISGSFILQENGYDQANQEITTEINTANDRVTQVQASITAQMQAADALVAELQSTQNVVNASIQSLNYVAFGKLLSSTGN